MSFPATTTSLLFDLFEQSFESDFQQNQADMSRPRQILGESVFNQFVKTEQLNQEFPLGLEKLHVPDVSPTVGTVTPMQLHSDLVESIFSPSELDSTPIFEDVELDSSNWKPLFEPSEMEIPAVVEQPVVPSTASFKVESVDIFNQIPTPKGSPNFTTEQERPQVKRSQSEAELELPISKRSSSTVSNIEDDLVPYNRKQRHQPLSPIVPESNDPIAQKRARNTEAARRSRARKMERMSQLEDKVDSLKQRNSELEDEVARLRALLAQR